jgi:hypothetical protein
MQVTAKYVNAPKNNSKYGSIKGDDGKYYGFIWADFQFDVGQTYDLNTEDKVINGKTYTSILSVNKVAPAAAANGVSRDRWWMPFVSNTVAHAIAAGQIATPENIKLWAAAAKQAALEIEKPAAADGEFVDDIPY